MKVVAVITNRVESYDAFISNVYPFYRGSFRFLKIEDVSRLKGIPLPTLYTKLSLLPSHHEAEELIQRLDAFGVPKIEAYDFTKENPEISKYL